MGEEGVEPVVEVAESAVDAEFLAKEFFPTFSPLDLANLPNGEIYLRLVIEGRVSKGFSGVAS